MKTAISIPDATFKAADKLARKLGVSRSELYAKAVSAFVSQHDEEAIIKALNEVYSEDPSGLDPDLKRAQARALSKDPW